MLVTNFCIHFFNSISWKDGSAFGQINFKKLYYDEGKTWFKKLNI